MPTRLLLLVLPAFLGCSRSSLDFDVAPPSSASPDSGSGAPKPGGEGTDSGSEGEAPPDASDEFSAQRDPSVEASEQALLTLTAAFSASCKYSETEKAVLRGCVHFDSSNPFDTP